MGDWAKENAAGWGGGDKEISVVIPAQAGILPTVGLGSRLRGSDGVCKREPLSLIALRGIDPRIHVFTLLVKGSRRWPDQVRSWRNEGM